MGRIFATADIGAEALARLREAGHELEVWPELEAPPHDVLLDRAGRVDVLVTTLRDPVDAAVLESGAGRLRLVAQDAVGHDNIDVARAASLGIAVSTTPGVLTHATAELALFLLGELARKLRPLEDLVREGRWGSWHPWHPFLGVEVTGKTIAVVGVGRIGRALASKCTGLDADLLLVGPRVPAEVLDGLARIQSARADAGLARRRASVEAVTLEEALPRADVISLHVPLVLGGPRPTRHLIGERELALVRPTALLVNTARGPVVDEAALAAALREGRLAGAALDVFEREPLPADSPLLAADLADRVRLTPHVGSGTQETRLSLDPEVGMAGRCVAAVLDALSEAPTWRYCLVPGR